MKDETNINCYNKAVQYLSGLREHNYYRIVRYNSKRGPTYGVLLNESDHVLIWDAFMEKIIKFGANEFKELILTGT